MVTGPSPTRLGRSTSKWRKRHGGLPRFPVRGPRREGDGYQVVAEREGLQRRPLGCSAPEEFAAFFTQYRGVVFRTVLAKTMDPAAAEDATAEAFACAYAHWDDTIAAHPTRRRGCSGSPGTSTCPGGGRGEAAARPRRRRRGGRPRRHRSTRRSPGRSRGLPHGQRDAFVLSALGRAPGTVRAQLHRARARLRLLLGEGFSPEGRDA
jgi:hypothetical protein